MTPPPRYTNAQIKAAVAAVLDEGISQQEAIRRAAKGTLAAGLDPFTLHKDALSRAKLRAELDRAQTAAHHDPRNAANTFARQTLAALTPSNQALLAQAQTMRPPDAKLRERARTMRELVALQGATEKKTHSAGRVPNATPDPEPAVDLASLLADQHTARDDSQAQPGALEPGDELAPTPV